MALDTSGSASTVIHVSTNEELAEAYALLSADPNGGTIELAANGGPYYIDLDGYASSESAVLITSADLDNPAHVEQIHLSGIENLTVDSVLVDSTHIVDRPTWHKDFMGSDCQNIAVTNSVFTHDAEGFEDVKAELAGSLMLVRDTDGITFSGNTVSGYNHGVQIIDSTNLLIEGNDISALQGDAMRFGNVHDVQILDNYVHDMLPSYVEVNHADMIQFWASTGTSSDVLISGNILLSGDGAALQGILINSKELGTGSEYDGYHENFVITDNLVSTGIYHGITASDVDGLVVDQNTVLWNQDALNHWLDGTSESYMPWIYTQDSINVETTNNISGKLISDPDTSSGNQIINYTDPSDPNYVDAHFVNVMDGATLEDLFLLPDSPWYGVYGSSLGVATEGDGGDTTEPTDTNETEPDLVPDDEPAPDTGSDGSDPATEPEGETSDGTGDSTEGGGGTQDLSVDTETPDEEPTSQTASRASQEDDSQFFLFELFEKLLEMLTGSSGSASPGTNSKIDGIWTSGDDVLLSDLMPIVEEEESASTAAEEEAEPEETLI